MAKKQPKRKTKKSNKKKPVTKVTKTKKTVTKANKGGSNISNIFNPKHIFFILGLSTFMGLIFMFVIYGSERAGTTPWWQVSILPNMTEGESWLFFIGTVLFAFFIGFFLISAIFFQKRRKR